MKIELIERLVDIARQAGASVLEYSDMQARVRLDLEGAGQQVSSVPTQISEAQPAVVEELSKGLLVNASMVGVFYRASAPDQPPLVNVGDLVTEGQTLGIVEAMKMLNPVEAPSAGRITKVLVSDGQSVEQGMPLFAIEENGV